MVVVPTKAATAGLTSAILVVAWTGVYLSRHSRSPNNEIERNVPNNNNKSVVYKFVALEENLNLTKDSEMRKEKVKEVKQKFF